MVLQARCFSLTSGKGLYYAKLSSQRDYGAQSEREDGQYIGSTDGTRMQMATVVYQVKRRRYSGPRDRDSLMGG